MDQAISEDINVDFLQAAYVVITFHLAAQPGLTADFRANLRMRSREGQFQNETIGLLLYRGDQVQQHPRQRTTHRHSPRHEPGAVAAEMHRAGVGRPVQEDDAATPALRDFIQTAAPDSRIIREAREEADPRKPVDGETQRLLCEPPQES